MPKKAKATRRKQSGKGVKENYEFVAKKYGPTFEDWLKTPLAQMALKEKMRQVILNIMTIIKQSMTIVIRVMSQKLQDPTIGILRQTQK